MQTYKLEKGEYTTVTEFAKKHGLTRRGARVRLKKLDYQLINVGSQLLIKVA